MNALVVTANVGFFFCLNSTWLCQLEIKLDLSRRLKLIVYYAFHSFSIGTQIFLALKQFKMKLQTCDS